MSEYIVYDPDLVSPGSIGLNLPAYPLPENRAAGVPVGPAGWAVVQRCWDGDTILPGPVTQAQVDALPACSMSPDETQAANAATIRSRAASALTANAAFLALATPTAAQTAAQIRALTRQVDGLIRLAISALDSIADS